MEKNFKEYIIVELPYVHSGDIRWDMVRIPRSYAEDILIVLSAELGYNLIKCVED